MSVAAHEQMFEPQDRVLLADEIRRGPLPECSTCGQRRQRHPSTWTYAMQRQGWVKIGVSNNPVTRRSLLARKPRSVRVPDDMDVSEPLLLIWEAHDGSLEHDLHERFVADHVVGEWFLPSAALRAVLAGGE